MKKPTALMTALTLLMITNPIVTLAGDEATTVQKAKEIAKMFGGQLKGELETAMQTGGALAAVEVCHQRAPAIAKTLSDQHQATVYRTSLKPRSVAPQDWEIKMLEQFNERVAKGEEIASMDAYQIVQQGDQQVMRYMKAVGTMPVCLSCHGTNISPELQAKLTALYPNDKAVGYEAGQLRGAFSIQLPL